MSPEIGQRLLGDQQPGPTGQSAPPISQMLKQKATICLRAPPRIKKNDPCITLIRNSTFVFWEVLSQLVEGG